MNTITRTKRVYRCLFRKLSKGQPYWLNSARGSERPYIKQNNYGYVYTWDTDGALTWTTVTPNTEVIRVPDQALAQNRVLN